MKLLGRKQVELLMVLCLQIAEEARAAIPDRKTGVMDLRFRGCRISHARAPRAMRVFRVVICAEGAVLAWPPARVGTRVTPAGLNEW